MLNICLFKGVMLSIPGMDFSQLLISRKLQTIRQQRLFQSLFGLIS